MIRSHIAMREYILNARSDIAMHQCMLELKYVQLCDMCDRVL